MAEKPGKQPADRKPSAKDDVETGPVVIEVVGETFEFERFTDPDDIPGDIIDVLSDDQPSAIVRELMTAEQWRTFKSHKPTLGDYKRVARGWLRGQGLGASAGE